MAARPVFDEETLANLSGKVKDPLFFLTEASAELKRLGESFGPEEVSPLAEYVLELIIANRSRDELLKETTEVMAHAEQFVDWMLAYVEHNRSPPNTKKDELAIDLGDVEADESQVPAPISSTISAVGANVQRRVNDRKRTLDEANVGEPDVKKPPHTQSQPTLPEDDFDDRDPDDDDEGGRHGKFKVTRITWDQNDRPEDQAAQHGGAGRARG
ncbi:hypothetical protein HK101_007088, partial [Irineochytrium annulatum]